MSERHIVVDTDPVTRKEFDALVQMMGADERDREREHEDLLHRLAAVMEASVETGVRKAMTSTTVLDALHDHLATRTRTKLAVWVFDRMTAVVVALVLAGTLTWFALFRGER